VPTGRPIAALAGHIQSVRGIAFTPDGKTLATGGDDRKVKLWNIATQQEVATLEQLRGGCRSLRFSPDGRTLAAGHILGADVEMWLWQVPSLSEIDAVDARPKPESSSTTGDLVRRPSASQTKLGFRSRGD
jgi:WD40 repeat protein